MINTPAGKGYRRPGFNCVVKQLRFWLFKVDCEFKDCDLRVLRIGHTCIIYTNNCELREKSQFAIIKLETRPTVYRGTALGNCVNLKEGRETLSVYEREKSNRKGIAGTMDLYGRQCTDN